MMKLAVAAGLSLAALAIGYWLLDKRPGYGAYYGIAKLTGARLDIGPVDFAMLRRHETPNDALVCPPGRCPNAEPDWEAKTYDMAPQDLLDRLTKVALAEPSMSALYCGTDCGHVGRFLQRSRLMGFPDTIDVEVFPVGADKSTLAIYSRSLVGRRDLGVNKARVSRLLAKLERTP